MDITLELMKHSTLEGDQDFCGQSGWRMLRICSSMLPMRKRPDLSSKRIVIGR